jgi:hypothetical protein
MVNVSSYSGVPPRKYVDPKGHSRTCNLSRDPSVCIQPWVFLVRSCSYTFRFF